LIVLLLFQMSPKFRNFKYPLKIFNQVGVFNWEFLVTISAQILVFRIFLVKKQYSDSSVYQLQFV